MVAFCCYSAGLSEPKNGGFRFRRQPSLVMPPCFPSFSCPESKEEGHDENESQPDKRDGMSFAGPSPCCVPPGALSACDSCGGGGGPFPVLSLPFSPFMASAPKFYSPWRCPQTLASIN
ncbi:hypothetical protein niasHS_017611 [Heterodera schachtii]|uniref:Uncharacterized protein n=1 Tax=Heterodera schachtii TaxID=97005 RepID=A0ABD2HXJ7_HETSC